MIYFSKFTFQVCAFLRSNTKIGLGVLILLFFCPFIYCESDEHPSEYIIKTIAGTGYSGSGGDGGLAVNADLSGCDESIAVDSSSNVYVTSRNNNSIRKISKSGVITKIAGKGEAAGGFSGDGGKAILAELNNPCGIAVDSSGNIYIADSKNNRIRKIDSNYGIITTIAGTGAVVLSTAASIGDGGYAINAIINSPSEVAVDSKGDIYIADQGNRVIRKIDNDTKIITSITGRNLTEGNSTEENIDAKNVQLDYDFAIAVDDNDNIYVAEPYKHRIRQIYYKDNEYMIQTIAGASCISGYLGDGVQAFNATLSYPSGVAVDSSGNIYITDRRNNVIRKIDKSKNNITTIAGTAEVSGYSGDGSSAKTAQFNWPFRTAVSSSGKNLYITDTRNNCIRECFINKKPQLTDGTVIKKVEQNANLTFEVMYRDEDNDPPKEGYPRVHIKINNKDEIYGSPFVMSLSSATIDYKNGTKYTYSCVLPAKNEYTFSFDAYDLSGSSATAEYKAGVSSCISKINEDQVKLNNSFFDMNGNSKIDFNLDIKEDGIVDIKILNANGEIIKILMDKVLVSGVHENILWDGTNESSEKVGSGIYFIQVITKNLKSIKKVAILR